MSLWVRGLLWTACCIASLTGVAGATTPRGGTRVAADTLTALPAAHIAKPLRTTVPLVAMETPPIAWMKLAGTGTWQAAWDAATGVPRQIWGSGLAAPGANGDAAVAETAARAALAAHLALLAPGASLADFHLVSNQTDGKIRTVGFQQYAGTRRVVGGQLSFWFSHDKLFVISSQALPHVTAAAPHARIASLAPRATTALRAAVSMPSAPVTSNGEEVVLPLVGDSAVMGYRIATTFTIDGGADGRYLAYVDPTDAGVIAVHQLNEYATGTVKYLGTDRYPGRGRKAYPASRAHVMVNGVPTTTNVDGTVTWTGDPHSVVDTSTDGDLVQINDTLEPLVTGAFGLDDTSELVWDASPVVENDAQVNAFINTNIAKSFVRANVDAAMVTLDDQIKVNVNLAQDCNAFFDGTALNFFHRTTNCENTSLIQDVVFHEYGHRVHTAEIIMGVGSFDGAMSEGAADFLAASITGDSGMGRGFFFTDVPLRELDPTDKEWRWPIDIGEIHHTGMIFGGTFWDLRKDLITSLGEAPGIALSLQLYVGALRRSVDIPTSLLATLAADDDDGDLSNGTPHECAIRDAFGRHGLRTVTGSVNAPGRLEQDALAIGIVISVSGLSDRCAGDELGETKVNYAAIIDGNPVSGTIATTPAGAGQYFAELPLSPQAVVTYQAAVGFQDGSVFTLPDNLGDPYYQLYTGHVKMLYCTDFESEDPLKHGWKGRATDNNGAPIDSPWMWGTPSGGATDPHAAYSGTKILAQVLDGDYTPQTHAFLAMPPIDVGRYTDVRLQYRRWLAVEDSHYDQAKISANGSQTWVNFTANLGDSSSTHHIDKEWRFHDVSLTPFFFGHTLNVEFSLSSDEGLNLGGWALDDVCVVANPNSICGDGIKTLTESCDDGSANSDSPDHCRTYCKAPACGDSIVDTGEECDEGSGNEVCSAQCTLLTVQDGGCCSASGGSGSLVLSLGVLGLVFRRRRR